MAQAPGTYSLASGIVDEQFRIFAVVPSGQDVEAAAKAAFPELNDVGHALTVMDNLILTDDPSESEGEIVYQGGEPVGLLTDASGRAYKYARRA